MTQHVAKSGNLVKIQKMVLLVGTLLMLIKGVAYAMTKSNVILSDALESIINIIAGSFALYSLIIALKPRDLDHPYGHGKIEFISASVEGSLIIAAGALIIGKSIYNFIFPQEVQDLDIGIYLTGGAGLINFILGGILVKQGKKYQSMIMEADGKHLLSDAYSTVGMIVGLAAVYFTSLVWIDNAVALIFGLIIMITGIKILRKSVPGIMDEADNQLLEKIISVLQENRRDSWIDLHNLRVIKYGSIYHLDCHLTLPWYFTVKEAHDEMSEIENLIRKHFGSMAEMFIHNDPCQENSCKLCMIEGCDVRQKMFEKSLTWDLEIVLRNEQHKVY